MDIIFEQGNAIIHPELMGTVPITYTFDDGTTQTILYPNNEPITINYEDGSSDTITAKELSRAFFDSGNSGDSRS